MSALIYNISIQWQLWKYFLTHLIAFIIKIKLLVSLFHTHSFKVYYKMLLNHFFMKVYVLPTEA